MERFDRLSDRRSMGQGTRLKVQGETTKGHGL